MTTFERIKEISKNKGYSLTKLNDMAGLGTNSIYHWRNKTPSTDSLQKVADVLNVSVDYLLGNTDEMHRNVNKETDLNEILDDTPILSFNGKPISQETRDVLKSILELNE